MSFLARSSPLAGGKTISSVEFGGCALKCISLCEFYYDLLLHIPSPSGILCLVRLFCRDSRLESYDREWMCEYAAHFFFGLTGYRMEDCL